MYHDVIAQTLCNADGAPPKGTNLYKLGEGQFRGHLDAIRRTVPNRRIGRVDDAATWCEKRPVFLTFDDGEASAYTIVADLLEQRNWRGHFFVVTDFIGRPGYLTSAQVRELGERGHAIGSHTCSHPVPISKCTWDQLVHEWGESTRILSDITGRPVLTASVPGGYYSRQVAEAAAQAGIRFLFTSEPRVASRRLGDCLVLGRYTIRRGMGPDVAAGYASGRIAPRWREAVLWNAKKVLKRANTRVYVRVRAAILGL
jgi:peptidoglycan/xylan/chitin deacetylase (PgdA/CDA1 family)